VHELACHGGRMPPQCLQGGWTHPAVRPHLHLLHQALHSWYVIMPDGIMKRKGGFAQPKHPLEVLLLGAAVALGVGDRAAGLCPWACRQAGQAGDGHQPHPSGHVARRWGLQPGARRPGAALGVPERGRELRFGPMSQRDRRCKDFIVCRITVLTPVTAGLTACPRVQTHSAFRGS
jgi:hypothetical protein